MKDEQSTGQILHGAFCMLAAHSSILRDLMRHLVEEEMLPPAKAARILRESADLNLPPEQSSGETFDAAREELLAIAEALQYWPGSGRAQRAQRKDLG